MEDKYKNFRKRVENYKSSEVLAPAHGDVGAAIQKDRDAIINAATSVGLSTNAVKIYYAELLPELPMLCYDTPGWLAGKLRRDVFDDAVSIVLEGKVRYHRPFVY